MNSQLRVLLAIIKQGIAEAEQQIANQRKRIRELQSMGLPIVEQEKTLDVMHVLASTLRDNQLMMERLISGTTEH